jgi:4-amino-4-deoxy-L-arabinose transferase-like glycosyltransferase
VFDARNARNTKTLQNEATRKVVSVAIVESALGTRAAAPARVIRIAAAIWLPAAVLALFAVEAALFVPFAYLNRDEGWYTLSGRLAFDGQVPYRDFPYFQMPLVPYVFGGMQALAGGDSIEFGRAMASALGICTVVLVLYIGSRLGGALAGAVAGALVLSSVEFMLASTTARAEAVVLPLTMLAAALALRWPRGVAGFAGPPAVLLLATAARLTFAPAFLAALAYCWWRARPSRRDVAVGLTLLLALAAVIALPVALSPGHAWFDVWTAQALRNDQFLEQRPDLVETLTQRTLFLRLPAVVFFVVLVPLLFYASSLLHRWREGWRPGRPGFGGDAATNHVLLVAYAVLLWLPFAGFNHQEARYFVPPFALLSIVTADVVVRARAGLLDATMRHLPAAFALIFAVHLVFQVPALADSLDRDDLSQTRAAGATIASLAGDGQIVALNPTLAVASGRPLPATLVMGQFSLWGRFGEQRARESGVVNVRMLEREMLDPRTRVVALDDYDLSVIAAFREEDRHVPADAAWPFKLFPSLIGRYEVAKRVDHFGQFNATLYVLARVG